MNQIFENPTAAGRQGTELSLKADVLVIGGGPAGAWAAIHAAREGASVVLADKGFCGTSGATAAAGTNVWYVPPEAREAAKSSRFAMGGFLAEPSWMDRVLEQTWESCGELLDWGYPFPVDEAGKVQCVSLQGADYMRLMRRQVKAAGVRILDQSPALSLLQDAEGAVAGAVGVQRQRDRNWRVEAAAVVIATGGCAFLSRALGCNVLTGDGYLMAAEAGAELSGMEFSNAYGLAPAFSSVTKSLFYNWATFYDARGREIEGAGSSRGRGVIARVLRTEPVYACLDRADDEVKAWMLNTQHNFFLSFIRRGVDPFTEHFPVDLRLEGTVRGTGGIRITDAHCATGVAGLFAAGDAATREEVCGGFTGGGSHNAAWAIASGAWAGQGAARAALAGRRVSLAGAGRTLALTAAPEGRLPIGAAELVAAVQAEVFPTENNWIREAGRLSASLQRLDGYWRDVRQAHSAPAPADVSEQVRAREATAMLATARWMYRSALARPETRGMARRAEYASLNPALRHRLVVRGLDAIEVRPSSVSHEYGALAA